jgi:mannose-6-phosphate isomerase-like protein (cupin superfamily)
VHNFTNDGDRPLKLYTVYAPPEEEPNTVHKSKAEAEEAEKEKEG